MSVPTVPAESRPAPSHEHWLGVMSLLVLMGLVVSAVVAWLVGVWLLGRRDLEGSEPMSVQGAYGWMAFAVSTAIFLVPVVIGLVLAVKAYRAGERRLGSVGMLVDGAILVLYPIVGVVNLLGQ